MFEAFSMFEKYVQIMEQLTKKIDCVKIVSNCMNYNCTKFFQYYTNSWVLDLVNFSVGIGRSFENRSLKNS